MSRFEGPQGIVTNGLVLNLDAGDPDSYTRSQPPYVEVLVVAGGGGGGYLHGGGGGGAGGLIYNSAYQITNAAAITVTVGAGGTSGGSIPSNGSNSVFGSLTAIGGGAGGNEVVPLNGSNGGSGGGGSGFSTATAGGTGTAGQGFNGGRGAYPDIDGTYGSGGGGGGAGVPGTDGKEGLDISGGAGIGGNGQAYSISGTSTYYAGGGGGGLWSTTEGGGGAGGLGGGGTGGSGFNTQPTAGTDNTGGGGGGSKGNGGGAGRIGGAGGSGIVIVRYPGLPAATGGTITYLNGYTIHTFTTSGTFTPYTWNDVSGNGFNSTLTNGVEFTSYQNGGVLSFDGTDDFGLGSISASTFSGASTISCWFYRRSITEWAGLFSNNVGTTSCNLLTFIYDTNIIGINQAGVSATYVGIDLGADHLNKWIYCVLVLAGSTNGSAVNVYAYKDGNLLTSTGNLYWSLTTHNQYYVGRHFSGATQILNGNIPVVQVYNRALSVAEVTQNFNAQRNRFGV
jgi:hypothetical protein